MNNAHPFFSEVRPRVRPSVGRIEAADMKACRLAPWPLRNPAPFRKHLRFMMLGNQFLALRALIFRFLRLAFRPLQLLPVERLLVLTEWTGHAIAALIALLIFRFNDGGFFQERSTAQIY